MSQVSSSGRTPAAALTQRGQRTRQQLLDAAEAVFGEKGYEQASISEITQRAGVAQGTFYVYFPDKKEAFCELVRVLSDRLRDTVLDAIAGLTDREEMERARFRAFFDFVTRHRNLYRVVRQCEFVDGELYRWYYRRFATGYTEGLRAHQAEGQVRPLDAEVMAWSLMGMADFLGMRYCLWERKRPEPHVVEDLLALLRGGLIAPRAPAKAPEDAGSAAPARPRARAAAAGAKASARPRARR